MVFTLEDSIVNMKNSVEAKKCAVRLLEHANKHSKSFPSQELKIIDREIVSDMFQCVEAACGIGLGPIMHQIFDVIYEEQEKLGRNVTQEEMEIIIRRAFQEYKPKENVTNEIRSKEDIVLKEEIILKV